MTTTYSESQAVQSLSKQIYRYEVISMTAILGHRLCSLNLNKYIDMRSPV